MAARGRKVSLSWVETRRGPATDPACTLRSSPRTLAEVLSGALGAEEAITDGSLEVDGPSATLDPFLESFSFSGDGGRAPAVG